jgi:hypothetical protein
MLIFLASLLATLPSILRSRAALGLENLALRHQIGVLHRSARKRPKLSSRAFGPVGVGIAIARDPLRRSGRALLTHPAPTLGDNA